MAVFNSLGSNYSSKDVWRFLFAVGGSNEATELKAQLSQKYGGTALLTYKGREALEIAVANSGLPKDSEIGINGFTCYVVWLAVKNAGYKPVFIDIAQGQTNFSLAELQLAHQQHPAMKAFIVQNTLGYPVDMLPLVSYAKQQNLMVIEDLAHSIGAVYDDGREAGTVGALVMLSFSQDKTIDVVAGGAVVDRRSPPAPLNNANLKKIGVLQKLKNRWYPFWTSLIRKTYPLGLGRFIHFGLKKLNLLSTPMSDDLSGFHVMPNSAVGLLTKRLTTAKDLLAHRRQIAEAYRQNLPDELQVIHKAIGWSSYLRFPIWVEDRQSLIDYLRNEKIYIGDTWYDAPIGPKKYLDLTDYKLGSCPNAESLADGIINLPTHQYVSTEVANRICAKIKLWQSSQQKP